MPAKHYFIHGIVQGVGFRFFTWKVAHRIGIRGFVRNCYDDSVEVVAVGDEAQIEEFSSWLKEGPRTSKVERFIESDYTGDKKFTVFSVAY